MSASVPGLRGWFHDKCSFSEARESVSAIHVDHLQPKGRIKNGGGADTDKGCWRLAFARHNCGLCVRDQLNRKRKETWDQCLRHVQDYVSAHKTCGAQALKLVSQASAIKELDALRGYGA